MSETLLEKTGNQISDAVGKASRTTARINDTLRDRMDEARVLARRGAHAAEEFADETRVHIKRHPVAAVTGSFLAGICIGTLLGWTLRRR